MCGEPSYSSLKATTQVYLSSQEEKKLQVVWRTVHTVEMSATCIFCNCMQSHFYWTCCYDFFSATEIQGQIPSDSTRFLRHFWMCIYCEVILTRMTTSRSEETASENVFYLRAVPDYDFKYWWKPLWWNENKYLLLCAAVTHSLLKKRKKVNLSTLKEIALIFFCQVKRWMKVAHHWWRTWHEVCCIKTREQIQMCL